jgi:hypothetical protein
MSNLGTFIAVGRSEKLIALLALLEKLVRKASSESLPQTTASKALARD